MPLEDQLWKQSSSACPGYCVQYDIGFSTTLGYGWAAGILVARRIFARYRDSEHWGTIVNFFGNALS